MKKLFYCFVLLTLIALIRAKESEAGSVTLQWDANTEPELQGYIIHYGSSSGNYSTSIDVGNVITYTINNLVDGTYYFAATAYDGTILSPSTYSNEVTKTLTSLPVSTGVLTPPKRIGGYPNTIFPGRNLGSSGQVIRPSN